MERVCGATHNACIGTDERASDAHERSRDNSRE
jgi:hypothetical protein